MVCCTISLSELRSTVQLTSSKYIIIEEESNFKVWSAPASSDR